MSCREDHKHNEKFNHVMNHMWTRTQFYLLPSMLELVRRERVRRDKQPNILSFYLVSDQMLNSIWVSQVFLQLSSFICVSSQIRFFLIWLNSFFHILMILLLDQRKAQQRKLLVVYLFNPMYIEIIIIKVWKKDFFLK